MTSSLNDKNLTEQRRRGRMSGSKFPIYAIMLSIAALTAPSSAGSKPQIFIGTVGDAVCGAKHTMEGDEISCLRTCIRRGSKYDLVVGDKVYVLDVQEKSTTDALDDFAVQDVKVRVKGAVNGEVIQVVSVAAAQ